MKETTKRRLLVPEVVQSSGMDCGPAALKSFLEGHFVSVSYGRLREACQTDVDGTSIETLEDLEIAAHDGRLEGVRGLGPRRTRGIRDSLAGILGRSARRHARRRRWSETEITPIPAEAASEADAPSIRPDVATLLAIDSEYRRKARAGVLQTITPRRFNPENRAWLPVLHSEKEGWEFTALFSNTARAHEYDATLDWVVVYYERDGEEDQCTVVTERKGPLSGRRVVRGRESECARHYAAAEGS